MGKMSRDKGKRGELEVAALLTKAGYPATRGRQHKGTDDSPDVICTQLFDMAIEVKHRETFSINDLYATLAQTQEEQRSQATGERSPLVFYRRNGKRWLAIMDAEDFLHAL